MLHSDSKLSRLLATLTAEECKAFGVFLASPFHQRSRKILDFWELLEPWFPPSAADADAREAALDKQRLFSLLFPDTPYKDSNLSNLMTTLSNLVEEFWVQQALQQHPLIRTRLLLQEYHARAGLEADFQRLWRSLEKKQADMPPHDPETLFFLLVTQEEYLSFQSQHQPRNADLSLGKNLSLLRQLTLLLNLKYYLATLNRQRLVEEELDTSLQEAIWQYVESEIASPAPVRSYAGVIRCLLQPEVAGHYAETKKLLAQDIGLLPDHEAKTLAYTLLNYLNGRLKAQGELVLPELLQLYRLSFDRGLLFSGEYLDAHVFLNILNVSTGVIKQLQGEDRAAEEAWRSSFVADNIARLHPELREETSLYARAYLAHQMQDYSLAYQLLNQYKPTDMLADLSRRSLLIRVYFDAWDQDLFDAQVKSALMYISRAAAVSESKRLAYNRFVRLSRLLFGLKGKEVEEKKLLAIRAEILDPAPLECRQWLLEKAEESKGHAGG